MAGTFGAGLLGMGGGAVIGGSIVRLFLDTKQFDAALAKTKGETEATAASGGSAMGKFSLLATAAYAAAAYAAVKFATSSVKAYQESEAANAQTVAVLKSTGEAAGMTYDAILNLAKGFQQTTTYSDEAVQSAENLILEFYAIVSPIDTAGVVGGGPVGAYSVVYVDPVHPVGHALDIQWSVDGTPVPGATQESLRSPR